MRNLVNKKYIVGRSNLAMTIFVPYDCPNNCIFCTSKKDYKDVSAFSLENILESIDKLGLIPQITDIVITGGEPFADLEKLQVILNKCVKTNKRIFINTTLPVKDDKEAGNLFNFIRINQDIISGLNISRHMCLKTNLEKDTLIEAIHDHTNIPVRINSVLLDVKSENTRLIEFIDNYSYFVNSINFRGDYTKIKNQDDLRGLDHPILNILFNNPKFNYITSGGCLVCNNNDFVMKNKFNKNVYISLHRGYEHSLVKAGNNLIINDFIIKQNGDIYLDWDCDKLSEKELQNIYKQWRVKYNYER